MITCFISHKRKDSGILANNIHKHLKYYDIDAFVDVVTLTDPGKFVPQIEQAIDDSVVLIVLLGKTTSSSDAVRDEIEYALSLNKTIIPIIQEDFDTHADHPDHINTVLEWNGLKIKDIENFQVQETIEKLAGMIRVAANDVPLTAPSPEPTQVGLHDVYQRQMLRALIIDDHEDYRDDILVRILRKKFGDKIHIDTAENKSESLKQIINSIYDIILVDIFLENDTEEAGFEIIREIRSRPAYANCIVIIVTAFAEATVEEKIKSLRHDGTQVKGGGDFTESLVRLIEQAIWTRRKSQAALSAVNQRYLRLQFFGSRLQQVELTLFGQKSDPHAPVIEVNELIALFDSYSTLQPLALEKPLQNLGNRIFSEIVRSPFAPVVNSALHYLHKDDLMIEIICEQDLFDVPFEVMWENSTGYLGKSALIYRRMDNTIVDDNDMPFRQIFRHDTPMRILLITPDEVGSDNYQELELVADAMAYQLDIMGVDFVPIFLVGQDAKLDSMISHLENDCTMLYYAGTGFEEILEGVGGIVLYRNGALAPVSLKNDLTLAMSRDLWFAFLSMPLRTYEIGSMQHIPLEETLGILSQRGVSVVHGFRSEVPAEQRKAYAFHFFDQLFRYFSVRRSAQYARRKIMTSHHVDLRASILVIRY